MSAPAPAWRRLFQHPIFSPMGFVVVAGFLTLLYFLLHLFGCREYATALTGTPASGGGSLAVALFFGGLYVLLHLIFVLLVPILLLASGIMLAALRLFAPRKQAPEAQPPAST